MIRYLELFEKIIGHIVWPTVFLITFFYFRKEIKSIMVRIKSAEIKDIKFELEDKIDDIRKEAISNGVTMFYPIQTLQREFNPENEKTKEMQVLDSWKQIENALLTRDQRNDSKKNVNDSLNYLVKNNKIEKYLAKLIFDLRDLRNIVVHQNNVVITEEEYQNWISISKSVIDRLNNEV